MEKEPEKVEENPRDVYGNDTRSVESRREQQTRQPEDFRIRNASSIEPKRKLQPS